MQLCRTVVPIIRSGDVTRQSFLNPALHDIVRPTVLVLCCCLFHYLFTLCYKSVSLCHGSSKTNVAATLFQYIKNDDRDRKSVV